MVGDRDLLVDAVGERRLVDMFMELFGGGVGILPHPDDAVAVRIGGEVVVLKADSFVASTDMPPRMSYYDVGWKSVVMNVSDLAAKGAQPRYFLSSIGIPRGFKVRDALDINRGIRDAAAEYGVSVLGGDVGECGDLVVSGFMVGSAPDGVLIPRRGAKPGDLLAVTGCFGLTYAALKTFMMGLNVGEDLQEAFEKALFRPQVNVSVGLALAASGSVSSSIDSSDGLLECMLELQRVNNVGFIVEELPVCEGVRLFAGQFGFDILDLVFRGGEEYELVVTLRPEGLDKALMAVRAAGGDLKVIGSVVEDPRIFCKVDGRVVELKGEGFRHFRK